MQLNNINFMRIQTFQYRKVHQSITYLVSAVLSGDGGCGARKRGKGKERDGGGGMEDGRRGGRWGGGW